MKIKDGETILFTGDSITDCGRTRPVGTADKDESGLGNGYVALLNSFIKTGYPELDITILNTGISGNRVTDLDERWQKDVVGLKPDWLSIMIGINDVWRQFDRPQMRQVTIDIYEETYRRLLKSIRHDLKGLVLMTPYLIEADHSFPMRKKMDEYGQIVRLLATEFDAVFIDVQAAFDRYLEHRPWQSLCNDRVHPQLSGHLIIAEAFRQAVLK